MIDRKQAVERFERNFSEETRIRTKRFRGQTWLRITYVDSEKQNRRLGVDTYGPFLGAAEALHHYSEYVNGFAPGSRG